MKAALRAKLAKFERNSIAEMSKLGGQQRVTVENAVNFAASFEESKHLVRSEHSPDYSKTRTKSRSAYSKSATQGFRAMISTREYSVLRFKIVESIRARSDGQDAKQPSR